MVEAVLCKSTCPAMQYIFKLSRVQGTFVFMLNARRSSKIPPDMYTYGQRIYRAVQWSECSIYVSVYSFPKLTSLPAKLADGGQRHPPNPPSGSDAPPLLFFSSPFLETNTQEKMEHKEAQLWNVQNHPGP